METHLKIVNLPWMVYLPVNQRAEGSIPSLEHMPALQATSLVRGVQEATAH